MSETFPKAVFSLPVYNGEQYLAEAIESLLVQTYGGFALIVLDNCSTDRTKEVALRYTDIDSRVVYERNTEHLGLVDNWRRAFELAVLRYPDAPYFAWASDHDVWCPEWLERLLAELERDRGAVLAYPYGAALGRMGNSGPWRPKKFDTAGIVDRGQRVLSAITDASAGWAAYGLFRAETLRSCGIYRKVMLPDRLLMAELCLRGHIRQVEKPLWLRRYRPGEIASHARQRRMLFDGTRPPLFSYLPWWLPHAAVLFWTLTVRRGTPPVVGRREGFVIATRYALHAAYYASKYHGLLRRWLRSRAGMLLSKKRMRRLVHSSLKRGRKLNRRVRMAVGIRVRRLTARKHDSP